MRNRVAITLARTPWKKSGSPSNQRAKAPPLLTSLAAQQIIQILLLGSAFILQIDSFIDVCQLYARHVQIQRNQVAVVRLVRHHAHISFKLVIYNFLIGLLSELLFDFLQQDLKLDWRQIDSRRWIHNTPAKMCTLSTLLYWSLYFCLKPQTGLSPLFFYWIRLQKSI